VRPSVPTVALTGATGFVGAAVLAELTACGGRPLVLLRPGTDRRRIAALKEYEAFSFERLDDPKLAEQLRGHRPATLIHCAWRGVAGRERNEPHQITENLPLAIDSVKLAIACGCTQWIGLGSQAEYGNLNRVMDETAPTLPTTIYGKSKLAASVATLALCEAAGLAGAWLRVFSTYGPGDAPKWLIPFVIREFLSARPPQLTRCEQYWDYLYVTDAARAILSAADGKTTGIFNLGSGEARPLKEIIEMVREELATTLEPDYGALAYRPDQVMRLHADVTRLRAATGWRPRVSLAEGLRKTIEWEKKHFAAARVTA
jgi:UDP-glucose 4-epimerase